VVALYYTTVELEISKNVTDIQTNRETHREQRTEISITEATLIPWIAGLSGPILQYDTMQKIEVIRGKVQYYIVPKHVIHYNTIHNRTI